MCKRALSLVFVLLLLLSLSLPALAKETEPAEAPVPPKTLTITGVESFLSFAEKCRLDSYSENLTVKLKTDIDLNGREFSGVPIFCGTFEGGGHTITGVNLTGDGSYQGLFRYLTPTAQVKNLNVQGQILPGGSQTAIGGIAGENAGFIHNCSFQGQLSGSESVGGIAGVNRMTGIVENSRARGSLHGAHFVGGIVGTNEGVVRDCVNHAAVNTSPQENVVSLTDVTLDSLVASESAATVTDIGGIAGISSGVIRSCVNRGDVGYQHMGYNVGGIAGTQSGYIADCENRGDILGRKEVGGIVGQMEPAQLIQYDEDALQILQGQIDGMSGIINRTAANVESAGSTLGGQVNNLKKSLSGAMDAVMLLMPDPENPKPPDEDTINAARTGLSNSMAEMSATMDKMKAATASAMGKLSNNLHSMRNQINAMSTTLGNASENLGGSVVDMSDLDTPGDITGKVENCRNFGSLLGDLNVGGIAGAMALENDLDVKEDLDFAGESSLNFESQLRAVILGCENQGTVTVGKRAGGGITGWQSLGLVKDSRNTGAVTGAAADYVGGISGQSTGFIRASYANCVLTGSSFVGGIAGSASIATDCRSMVRLEDCSEQTGAILGGIEENDQEDVKVPISGNLYFSVREDFGGIDGISYQGLASGMDDKGFFSLEGLPEIFDRAIVTFRFADGNVAQVRIPTGEGLKPEDIPALPEQKGSVGRWAGLEEADTRHIYFDMTFDAEYTSLRTVIQTEPDSSGKPRMLLLGEFSEDTTVDYQLLREGPPLGEKERLAGAWEFSLTNPDPLTGLRLRLPEGCDGENVTVQLRKGGAWETVPHTLDGSYLVLTLEGSGDAVAVVEAENLNWQLPAILGGSALLVLIILILLIKKIAKKPKQEKITDPSGEDY